MTAFGGENAESYYDEGVTASMKGDISAAARFFEKAIEFDRNFLAAYHQLGKCYLRMGQSQRALMLLKEVLRRKPDQTAVRLDYGYALLQEGEYDTARDIFNQVLTVDRSNGRAHLGLAHISFQREKWNQAVALAQAADMQGSISFGLLFLGGRAANKAGDLQLAKSMLDRAAKLIEQSMDLKPDQPECHFLRGEVAFALEEYNTALEHFRAAGERAQDDQYYSAFGEHFGAADIHARLAECYFQRRETDQAIACAKRALALNPNHAIRGQLPQG